MKRKAKKVLLGKQAQRKKKTRGWVIMSFELSEAKYIAMLRRIKILEEAYNDMATAINNLATQQQVQELLVIIQADIKNAEEQLAALENRIVAIEEEPLS